MTIVIDNREQLPFNSERQVAGHLGRDVQRVLLSGQRGDWFCFHRHTLNPEGFGVACH